jgi:hypothetical protein
MVWLVVETCSVISFQLGKMFTHFEISITHGGLEAHDLNHNQHFCFWGEYLRASEYSDLTNIYVTTGEENVKLTAINSPKQLIHIQENKTSFIRCRS